MLFGSESVTHTHNTLAHTFTCTCIIIMSLFTLFRKSFDASILHRANAEDTSGDGEGVDGDDRTGHLHPATRSLSVKPRLVPVKRDSLNSDSSTSGDSDTVFNRRSGSAERQDNAVSFLYLHMHDTVIINM